MPTQKKAEAVSGFNREYICVTGRNRRTRNLLNDWFWKVGLGSNWCERHAYLRTILVTFWLGFINNG